jgi:hypothetical protein
MAAAMVVPVMEEVEDDLDSIDPGEDEEEDKPEPSPAYKRFMAAADEMESAAKAAKWDVFAADAAPEPYHQELLYELRERMKAVKNCLNEERANLKTRVVADPYEGDFLESLQNPPGYPERTERYGPLSAEQVAEFRAGVYGSYTSIDEVRGREGSILYCLPAYWEPHPDDPTIGDWPRQLEALAQAKETATGARTAPAKAPAQNTSRVAATVPATAPATDPAIISQTQPNSRDDEEFDLDDPESEQTPVKPKPAGPRKEDRFKLKKRV